MTIGRSKFELKPESRNMLFFRGWEDSGGRDDKGGLELEEWIEMLYIADASGYDKILTVQYNSLETVNMSRWEIWR